MWFGIHKVTLSICDTPVTLILSKSPVLKKNVYFFEVALLSFDLCSFELICIKSECIFICDI